jgi:hypothetical protein
MPQFSKSSLEKLGQCDPRLQNLFKRIVEKYDCTILVGHRDKAAQDEAFNKGASQKPWPESLHNGFPSLAVDVAPYPLNWNDKDRFYHFGGYVQGVAAAIGMKIRWGGDFDQDGDLHDQTLYDLVHFEIDETL